MKISLAFSVVTLMTALLTGEAAHGTPPQIASDATLTQPLKKGTMRPDVAVKTADGDSVKLSALQGDGPLVIVFFRGGWCPICSRHFGDLVKVHPEIAKAGAKMIAISPDSESSTQANAQKLKTPFPLYSDADLTAAKAFGLAFKVDDDTLTRYKGFGIDLQKASGRDHQSLPVPAVYIVDPSGIIRFAHSNPDYRKRLDGAEILAELRKLQ